jgi:hypothetical protein
MDASWWSVLVADRSDLVELDREPEQCALFELEGPDEDACVWLTSGATHINLGPQDAVAGKMADWLAAIDFGE